MRGIFVLAGVLIEVKPVDEENEDEEEEVEEEDDEVLVEV